MYAPPGFSVFLHCLEPIISAAILDKIIIIEVSENFQIGNIRFYVTRNHATAVVDAVFIIDIPRITC